VAAPKAALLSLAESVADGSAIDWAAAMRSAAPEDYAVIRQLQVLEDLAVLHRSLPVPTGTGPRLVPVRSTTTPAIGTWAHLSLVERLGRGTFGEVYRAWDRHLERDVALKLLHGTLAADDAPSLSRGATEEGPDPHVAAILREARLLARVRHPNVVQVYGVAIHEGRVGLWMELIRGETLEQLLVRNGPFNAREAAIVGIDLCRALAAIHAAGLVHRDVKAQNVMRETGGRIVLMDLGTGRPSGPRALPDLEGTPLYLAPEIFAGAPASERTDIYSLGVLLYHLVTSAFPVQASSVVELEQRHADGAHVRLRDTRADLPTAFVSVVERALSSDERRFSSAGALEAALLATLEDGAAAVIQHAAGAPERRRWWAQWRTGVLAAAVAVAVALGGLAWPSLRERVSPATATSIRAIAVLPLANLSNDPGQEYFADGMTDELIATLGQLDGVNVISRTSVMRYKGSRATVPEIAKTLGVDAVLEGSVLVLPEGGERNKRIRINARLIYAGTDTHLWNRSFERSGDDVLTLQSEIARAVSEGINARLGRAAAVRGSQPQNFDAFDLYLRGRYSWNMRNEEGLTQSVRYFQEAIIRDPRYAPAFAGLADAYNMLGYYGFLGHDEAMSQARAAARAALEHDPSLGEAHASLGNIQANLLERDAAEASFRRAIELNPAYATAHHWYAVHAATQQRFDEALDHIQTASTLDPLSVNVKAAHGIILLWARRYDEAIGQLRAALGLDPGLARLRASLGRALAVRQEYDLALAEATRAQSLAPNDILIFGDVASILAMSGRRSEAAAMAQELAGRYLRGEHAAPIPVAVVYAALRDNDRAFEWLDRARQQPEPWLGELKVDVRFDNLRNDPRFANLLREIGLPP
jgi:TolB-like protein